MIILLFLLYSPNNHSDRYGYQQQSHYNRKKDEVPAEVTELVEKRAAAKKAKNWAAADAIRAQLTEMGWAVKDTAQGPQLSKI